MLKRVPRMLVVFIVAFGLAMPAGGGAMAMSGDMMGMVKAVEQPCPHCPQPYQTGGTTPDKMPGCQALACISTPAVLPNPVLMPTRALMGLAYMSLLTPRFAGAAPVPDPFPPRPIILP
jgi:hypothetical protein